VLRFTGGLACRGRVGPLTGVGAEVAAADAGAGGFSAAAAGPDSCGVVGLINPTLVSSPGVFQPMISKCGRRRMPKEVFIGRSLRLMIGITREPRNARMTTTASLRAS
jgi:hypothetical protein